MLRRSELDRRAGRCVSVGCPLGASGGVASAGLGRPLRPCAADPPPLPSPRESPPVPALRFAPSSVEPSPPVPRPPCLRLRAGSPATSATGSGQPLVPVGHRFRFSLGSVVDSRPRLSCPARLAKAGRHQLSSGVAAGRPSPLPGLRRRRWRRWPRRGPDNRCPPTRRPLSVRITYALHTASGGAG